MQLTIADIWHSTSFKFRSRPVRAMESTADTSSETIFLFPNESEWGIRMPNMPFPQFAPVLCCLDLEWAIMAAISVLRATFYASI